MLGLQVELVLGRGLCRVGLLAEWQRVFRMEAVLAQHPCVADSTIVGVPSEAWGETPVGFYVPAPEADVEPDAIMEWINARLGKTQRLSALMLVPELPRSAIGKVLKRELRDRYVASDETSTIAAECGEDTVALQVMTEGAE